MITTSPADDFDDYSGDNEPVQKADETEAKLRRIYQEGKQCERDGDSAAALECYKQIYMVDYDFEDVAEIVESSYEDDV